MKFIIFTTDVIPIAGLPTSGTALRSWGLGQGLIANGHQVVYSVPSTALASLKKSISKQGISDLSLVSIVKDLEANAFNPKNQARIIADHNPDAVICGHWPAMMLGHKPRVPLIIDLAGPHMLERHYQGTADAQNGIAAKLAVISTADYFIVSGRSQRLYFLSYLLRAEVPAAEKRIVTIPMPLDPAIVKRSIQYAPGEFPKFIFGGVFLPWQDPTPGLNGVVEELDKRNRGSLQLIGGQHPNYPIAAGVYEKLFANLKKNPRVSCEPMLPYDAFLQKVLTADVAVDLMSWNLERQLALTIRSTSYLAAGLPVIYNDFADLSALIREYDAGWTVDPKDKSQLAAVFEEIYSDPEAVYAKAKNAKRLALDNFCWDTSISELLNVIDRPVSGRLRETDLIIDYPDSADLEITAQRPIKQFFCSRLSGLSRVEVRIATHGRNRFKPLTLELFEVDNHSPSARTLKTDNKSVSRARMHVQASSIQNNDWLTFDFDPIVDSAGKTFMIELRSEAQNSEEAISPWALKGSPYPLLALQHGSENLSHTAVCIKTSCSVLA